MVETGAWPYDGSCTYDRLIGSGWRPSPLREFIFKVQSRCNLNCDYCYVYNLADDGWRQQPHQMSRDVVETAASRILEHAQVHGLDTVLVSLHGGEPLLRGTDPVRRFATIMRETLAPVDVHISMQTNATLVTAPVAAELGALDVRVGASIDGDAITNDRHRTTRSGRSSFVRTLRGIEHLAAVPGLLNGLLCVIDLVNDPVETYEFLAGLGAPSIDFLLPHGNWEERPEAKTESAPVGPGPETPYGDWLVCVYDHWSVDRPKRVDVRILDDIVHLHLGGAHTYEGVGLQPAQLLVVETNGDIELVDHLKSAYDGAAATGLNVRTDSFDDALRNPGVICRQLGRDGLSDVCRDCDIASICGAGLVSHRFARQTGFLSPTVYCSDMYRLVTHIGADLRRRIDATRAA